MGILRLTASALTAGVVLAACTGGGGPTVSAPPTTLPVPRATEITAAGETRTMRWGRVYQRCLIEAGLPAVLDPDGGVRTNYPKEQRDAASEAFERCTEVADAAVPHDPPPASEADWQELYDFEIALAECLARYGFTSDPPSFERWMDSGGEAWSAYNAVPQGLSDEEWNGINNACPQAYLTR